MKNKIVVKIKEGGYLKENNPYRNNEFMITENIIDATTYTDMVEFLLSSKMLEPVNQFVQKHFDENTKLERIDIQTLKSKKFTIKKEIAKIDKELLPSNGEFKVSKKDFNLLVSPCGIGSSQFLYDEGNFSPWSENPSLVTFYKRGLANGLRCIHVYRNVRLPSCYSHSSLKVYNHIELVRKITLSTMYGECGERITFIPDS